MRLSDFEGRWRIDRRIEDMRAGRTGWFEGQARLTADGQGLAYRELGELRLGGARPLAASRRFLWRAEADGIAVLYEDGTPFHRIAGGAPVVQAFHACGPDDYEVSYNFTRWPAWRVIWRVRGPRKEYVSVSDYTRFAGG